MTRHSFPDRESLQLVLASAFAVQDSGIDVHTLSALAEIRRLVSKGAPDLDILLQLIAHRARNVRNATGIAIALLEGDQLVYRAGSGDAAARVGFHSTAILSVSVAQTQTRSEILRVENAKSDKRIEAEICRQLGVTSLLILPLYDQHAIVGLLEAMFDEPHKFHEDEVRIYRLMARLAENLISRATETERKDAASIQPTILQHASSQITQQTPNSEAELASAPEPLLGTNLSQACEAEPPAARKVRSPRLIKKKSAIISDPGRRRFGKLLWSLAAAAAIAALLLTDQVAHHHTAPLQLNRSEIHKSNGDTEPNSTRLPVTAKNPSLGRVFRQRTMPLQTSETTTLGSAFRQVQVHQNEIDYIADDVTIRHFTTTVPPLRLNSPNRELDIGEDVTVRYFDYKPTVSPQTSAATVPVQSVGRAAESK